MEFKLEYTINDENKVVYLKKEVITIGKLPENDIELNDNTVSRQHCRLVRMEKSFKLMDLKSTNGSFVNGKRVMEKVLQEGDKITVGRTTIEFKALSPAETFQDRNDQQISMVVPLSQLIQPDHAPKLRSEEPNFLAALTKLGKTLIAAKDLEESFKELAEMIFDFVCPEKILIFYYDEKLDDLHLKYTYAKTALKNNQANISKTIALKAIHEKVAILSSNTRNDNRFDGSKSVILYGINSAISVPIWTKDSIYGLIYADTTSFAKMFIEKDLEMLSIIANFAGFSIEGINSLEKLNRERKLRARLERYHSPVVVSRMIASQDDTVSEFSAYREVEASVLFMDIVSFTSRAEKMTPMEVGLFLNNFFTEMTEIIFKHNGTLDKFIGDAVMAVFGVPFEYEDHARSAIDTALEMMAKVEEINRPLPAREKIRVRIGINSGKLISGDFGSPKRIEYTVLGNTVNIASRLESTVAGANEIVVSECVQQNAGSHFEFEFVGEKKLHGISKPLKVYKVIRQRGAA